MILAIRHHRGVCDTPLRAQHVRAYRIRPHAKIISTSIPLARPSETSPRFAAHHPIPSPGIFPRAAIPAILTSLRVTTMPPLPATELSALVGLYSHTEHPWTKQTEWCAPPDGVKGKRRAAGRIVPWPDLFRPPPVFSLFFPERDAPFRKTRQRQAEPPAREGTQLSERALTTASGPLL